MADKENTEYFMREVVESITLGRGDKRIKLTTGMKFGFTQEELEQLKASSPNAVSSKTIVDLDSADADLSLREIVQQPNQKNSPDGKGKNEKPMTKAEKAAAEKAAKQATGGSSADDEL